ncbi:hypothetical protein L228DRAFT_247184 [Xylona heveae TC161]|uniref:Oxidoreductase-like domain-containing protein n=1 Tax=Xylona heveae (strain CBS 132557 / TC161) TaxID=1328760 RepID=A0A165GZJ0_XYLHT|nr:hypothetical protein L228DRAFT_247184 [Xylona heveae TC161]KZF22797.1 hypothetical protein L228DRAFT_247184 [Xylona heveae TC161]
MSHLSAINSLGLNASRIRIPTRRLGLQNSDRIGWRFQSHKSNDNGKENEVAGQEPPQAKPLSGYYKLLLNDPQYGTQPTQPTTRKPAATARKERSTKSDREERAAKARVVFGSRLAGPVERQARREEIASKSVTIAGIKVPPRPGEPDNCCMSGCVNCVWDRYRDELEEWAARTAEARQALQKQKEEERRISAAKEIKDVPQHVASSMDDDGGGSGSQWGTGLAGGTTAEQKDLFADIPIGIREFMRTEKKLKEKHLREGSARG